MRQRILMLVVLLASHSATAGDPAQVGRYLTVAPIPTSEQREPLSVVVHVRFPRSVQTVGDAIEHLLPPSGFQVADTRNVDPQMSILMTRPLPEVHRQIGPVPLQSALQTLAGDGWQLEVDPVHRLVSFRLQGPLRERFAQAEPPVWTPSAQRRERPETGWIDTREAQRSVAGDRYGPVQPDETLFEIALHQVEAGVWPDRTVAWRGQVALLRANPDAFLTIDGTPNLNLVRTGAYLQIPAAGEVLAIPRSEAEQVITQQREQWQQSRAARTGPQETTHDG